MRSETPCRVLIIEDTKAEAEPFEKILSEEGYHVEIANNAEDGLARARKGAFDVVLTDLHLGSSQHTREGLDIVTALHSDKPQLPVILMTGKPTTATTIEAMKLGAYDSIIKSRINWDEFKAQIKKAAEISRLQIEPAQAGTEALSEGEFQIIGNSPIMHEVYKQIGLLAAAPVTVLIRGETGTGKELVAHALHEHSPRNHGPFVPVNCAAIPENLLESELFGHEAGAFTGAIKQKIGRFEEAHGGTIFLDEVGDMAIEQQVKLLRVLQEKTIQRVGGKQTIPVDVRVVAATNRDLALAIVEKQFREDLYYRLNVGIINLPPLRDRREDIPDLVEYFLGRSPERIAISREAIELLQEQSWPGNVRQLSSVISRAMILGRTITRGDILAALAEPNSALPTSAAQNSLASLVTELLSKAAREQLTNVETVFSDTVERELYAQALKMAGNQLQAAKWLGVSRTTMREKLIRYGLHPTSSSD